VAHLNSDNKKLVQRVRRIRGQVEAIERALAGGSDCGDLLQLIAAVRGATAGLMGEVLEDHVRFHVVDPSKASSQKQGRAAQQLIDVLKTYLR
jgi:DNA-binding FrmR family transcriptional regulator